MADDYRNTKYCPNLTDLINKKNAIKKAVLSKYPQAKDMHTYISRNNEPFKQLFVEAYNGKCAYCGASTDIMPWRMLEIDHFIPKVAARFEQSKANAGYIENLVLACYDCNRSKRAFECPDEDIQKVHPDCVGILDSFVRDDEYYIRIGSKMNADKTVVSLYQQMDLGSQPHRIDYLLMNMRGLCEKITDEHPAYGRLMGAIDLLQRRRNCWK